MAVTNDDLYKPEQALQRLREQEQIINALVDTQVCLQLLLQLNLVSREDIITMREKVRNGSKYKPTIDNIEQQRAMFESAEANPEAYLKALLRYSWNEEK